MSKPTIQDIITGCCWLEIRCMDCENIVHTPYRLLPERLPLDLPCHLAAAFYRCSRCQGKQLASSMWDMTDAPGYVLKRA